jgi:phytoene/squalene synthetase
VEWLCVRECLRFSLRHRRYFLIFLTLYWYSLGGWRRARAARYGYCFLQLYDDVMDGDRRTDTPPEVIAAQTIDAWASGEFRQDSTLARLEAAFDDALRSLPVLPGDDPRHDVLVLLQAMRLDAYRVATKSLLSRTQMKDQLRNTFHHSLNLLLIASHLRTRAKHVPDLVQLLGWCSVVRDLNEDLRRGLVNVPSDVVARVGSAAAVTARHPEVRRWLEEERLIALEQLVNSAAALRAITADEPRAGRILGLFHRSIARYASASPQAEREDSRLEGKQSDGHHVATIAHSERFGEQSPVSEATEDPRQRKNEKRSNDRTVGGG